MVGEAAADVLVDEARPPRAEAADNAAGRDAGLPCMRVV